MTTTTATTQIHRVYIKASPATIWEAITSPEWTVRYGYQAPAEYDLRPGGAFRSLATAEMIGFGLPEVVVDGEVVESDPPNKLVQTYRFLFGPENEAEGFTTLTWELEAENETLTRLTVIHELTDAPIAAAMVAGGEAKVAEGGGGWPWILSDLKTLLESGTGLQEDQNRGQGRATSTAARPRPRAACRSRASSG